MSGSRIALVAGMVLLVAFFALVVGFTLHGGIVSVVVVVVAMAVLIGGGNLLYGRDSHGAAAQARVRPAQEAHDQAAAVAAEARRAVAAAERRGDRYCPLDPARRAEGEAPARQAARGEPSQAPPPAPDAPSGP